MSDPSCGTFATGADHNEEEDIAMKDRQTQARLEEIASQVREDQPLASPIGPISQLEAEYGEVANFLAGIRALQQDYCHMRMIRGDGNCYYRAFLYSLAEAILTDPTNLGLKLLQFVKEDIWKSLLAVGYDEMMLETFHDSFVDLMERIVEGKLTADQLHDELNQETSTSDYCTWYLRAVTAAHLKLHADRFLPFMEGAMDLDTFCKANVEPMGKECEHVQVLALAEAFSLQVIVAYLDGHDLVNGKVVQHEFGPQENARGTLSFLYRPGHYDILYV